MSPTAFCTAWRTFFVRSDWAVASFQDRAGDSGGRDGESDEDCGGVHVDLEDLIYK